MRKSKRVTKRQAATLKLRSDVKKAALDKVCVQIDEVLKKNAGKKPYGTVSRIVDQMKPDFPWINRDNVNYAYRIHQQKARASNEKRDDPEDSNASSDIFSDSGSSEDSSSSKKSGRPKGTTMLCKKEKEIYVRKALDEIAIKFDEKRKSAKALGTLVKKRTLDKIIEDGKKKFRLGDDIDIKKGTIRARGIRESLVVKSMGPASPMAEIEPILIDLILRMSTIRRCLTPSQCLHLANNLFKELKIEKKLIEFKEKLY